MKKENKFNDIVTDNGERIKRICNYYSSNQEDRKDMYQEILVNIWKSLDSFRGDASISIWIYRIAVNTSLGFTGKAFKQMQMIVDADTENISLLLDDGIDEKLEQEARLNQLQIELNQMSVIEKSLMSLLLEGLSMREIADVIGIAEPNVKVKIHRIKEQLKSKLSGGKHE